MRLRRVPFHEALIAPPLWLGCDPLLLALLATACALLGVLGGIGYQQPALAPVGALAFWAGRKGLVKLAERDPQLVWVYLRALSYNEVYPACSRWDARERPRRRWL